MAEVLVVEFATPEAMGKYLEVNRILEVDADGGAGNWPAGMTYHVGATSDSELFVLEVWDSRSEQEQFMSRLQPALDEAKMEPPKRAEWFTLAGQMHRDN